MTKEQRRYLKNMLRREPYLFLDQIHDKLAGKYNKSWSTSCIYKTITIHLKLSLQQITMMATQANQAERLVYKANLSCYEDPAMFVFVDETMVGKNASRRSRNWAPKGGDAPIGWEAFMDPECDIGVYSMIAAVDINGFIPSVAQPVFRASGDTDRNLMRGTINADYFEQWLEFTLVPQLGLVGLNQKRSVVVMDNARVHNMERVEKIIRDAGADIVWNAAYSPDLNPIERCFRQYKSELKRLRYIYPNLVDRHICALDCVTRKNMINYYGGKAFDGCIRNLPNEELLARAKNFVTTVLCGVACGEARKRRRLNT